MFGDYRNYFQNRVTLQLIAKGRELAKQTGTQVTAILLGEDVHQYAMEYVAHGADVVMVGDHSDLRDYRVETYTDVLAGWVKAHRPDIFLAGATSFGREFFPRLAKRLRTGLSADCVALEVDRESGLLMQTTPSFGGELLADVVTPHCRPQMATVHPGVFRESPHDAGAMGRIIYPPLELKPESRLKLLESVRQEALRNDLEDAQVLPCNNISGRTNRPVTVNGTPLASPGDGHFAEAYLAFTIGIGLEATEVNAVRYAVQVDIANSFIFED